MSLQSVLFVARRRALFHCSARNQRRVVAAARKERLNPNCKPNQHRWLSIASTDKDSWEKSTTKSATSEPLERLLQGENETLGTTTFDHDQRLEEIRSSLRTNVKSILDENPHIRHKWTNIVRLQERERRRASRARNRTHHVRIVGADTLTEGGADTSLTEDDKNLSFSGHDSIEIKGRREEATGVAVDSDVQPTNVPSPEQNNSEGALDASPWAGSADESEDMLTTSDTDLSFLDMLRRPIENDPAMLNEDTAFEDSAENAMSSVNIQEKEEDLEALSIRESQMQSDESSTTLLDLLTDDDAGETQSSESASIEAQPSTLLDLLNDTADEPQASSWDENSSAPVEDSRVTEEAHSDQVQAGRHSSVGVRDIDEGVALLLSLRGRDWAQMEQKNESKDDDDDNSSEEAIEEEFLIEEDVVGVDTEEEEAVYDEEEQDDEAGVDALWEMLEELLEEASHGETVLTCADYNALLLNVATSSLLPTDQAVPVMLLIYQQMSELGRSGTDCSPDATTFTILMATLARRANAPLSATNVCRQMMDSGVALTSASLVQGISCLENRSQIGEIERLMNSALDDEMSQVVVPLWAWTTLLRMYKNENMQESALNLIDKCIEKCSKGTVDKAITETIFWPRRDRGGHRLDRSSLLSQILDKLESLDSRHCAALPIDPREEGEMRAYKPSYDIWKHLVLSLSSEVHNDTKTGWDLVQRAFKSMSRSLSEFWPDASLLKTGLGVAEAKGDSELAVDLVLRLHKRQFHELKSFESTKPLSDHTVGADDEHSPFRLIAESDSMAPLRHRKTHRVPLQAYTAAMRLCAIQGDTDSADRLLDALRDSRCTMADSMKRDLYVLALKGCAKRENSDAAQALLLEIQDSGLNPTDEVYGTVIHTLAVNKKIKEAVELFESVRSGQFGDDVVPGVACYNARILAHVEANEWEEVLACHAQRKEAGLPWTPASFQDVLLASYRLGSKAKALEVVEEALESGMKMDYGGCAISLQILLGDVLKSKDIDQARRKLRTIGESNEDLKEPSLNLSRSLRSAEVEEKREATKGWKGKEPRRHQAWNDALKYMLDFTRAVEKSGFVGN